MGNYSDFIISKSSQEPEGMGWKAGKISLEENWEEMALPYEELPCESLLERTSMQAFCCGKNWGSI